MDGFLGDLALITLSDTLCNTVGFVDPRLYVGPQPFFGAGFLIGKVFDDPLDFVTSCSLRALI